ncbi:MAG TPA: hypothetical protein VIE88_18815 [Vicinamibacteria bacterium]|jgi:hypothetical protein
MPKEIAIEIPKEARRAALARAVQRRWMPAMSRMPSVVSASVAASAKKGIVERGRNDSTSAV